MGRILFVLRGCTCSKKAMVFLNEFGLEAEIREVRGPAKSWEVSEYVDDINVPVLVEKDETTTNVVNGVNNIADYLESKYGPDKSVIEKLKWNWIMLKKPGKESCGRCQGETASCCTRSPIEA